MVSDLVAFCLSRLLLVLQRGDVGFVEDAWAGDSGFVFDGVCVFLLFFDLSLLHQSQPLKFWGRFSRP